MLTTSRAGLPAAWRHLGWPALIALLVALLLPGVPAQAQSIVTVDLCATTGTTTLPDGVTVAVLGYTPGDCSNTPAAQLPGPTIVVNAGDSVQVTLHNALGEATALQFPGQALPPDLAGAPPGGTALYQFVAATPGTYLYEAGLLPNAQHQTAMGMYGALVVRPATAGQAYDAAATAYDREALVVLAEIDPALNNSPSPAGFDMRNFKARYGTINGKAYPATDPIPVLAGERVLLRYVNAGLQNHSMGVLGLNQTLLATDGNLLAHSHGMVAESLAPGQTADALITIPATAAPNARFALHDGGLLLNNNGAGAFGGILTFLVNQDPGGTPTDTVGPATTGVAATFSAGDLTIAATVSDLGAGDANLQAAEFYLDVPGGIGGALAASDSTFDSPTEAVGILVPGATLAGLATGSHTVYVRGQDANGNWGSYNLATFSIDRTGPATGALVLSPNPSGGNVDVSLAATADDAATGGSNIVAALYSIDGAPGVPMAVNVAAPVAALSATIPQATLATLADGAHDVAIMSQDAAGNWGAIANLSLLLDRSGPATSAVTAAPNPNNGYQGVSTAQQSVRVDATVSEPGAGAVTSNVKAVEGFIDTVGADGTGFPFTPRDGLYNSPVEAAYAFIPLTTIRLLADGTHQIHVHGQDANGNWGATTAAALLIDRTPPTFASIALGAPSIPAGTVSVALTVNGADDAAGSGVTGGEYWFGATDITPGTGTAFTGLAATVATGSLTPGSYTVRVRIRDAAGNWSAGVDGVRTASLAVIAVNGPLTFSTTGNANPPGVGGTADDADLFGYNGTAFSRSFDATTAGLPGGANVDGLDAIDATHFSLSFAGNHTVPGIAGTVQDEDIVYYNAGAWSLLFDGSTSGLASASFDLDAISIVAGTLYFSTDNGNVPPGAGGTGDDADIYRWNGGSSYTRVVDASGAGSLGLPGGANVDGFEWVDATHFYLSFTGDIAVPGLGTVQDEDVVYYNAGAWSVYFDGTAPGLTSAALDVDSFDLP